MTKTEMEEISSLWVTIEQPSVIWPEKNKPMEILVLLTSYWVTIKGPSSIMKKILKLQ